ncbi:MAG TPA: hypothetical protein VG269_28865 [Tepidisphaeraceae bacterium]|nr:hypothetical protein [Tepidisphaeraceae bacterium]
MTFKTIFGVDFSGAKLAGENMWIARTCGRGARQALVELDSVAALCGAAERPTAMAYLVGRIAASRDALWAMDFPFGLPIEVMDDRAPWARQLEFIRGFGDDAYAAGVECLRRAKLLGGPNHIRRCTDHEAKTPFDCYHYRIIYQTFHGMRDVLSKLIGTKGTAILPFQYRRLPTAARVLVEACPGSTLKRMGLPHQNYKQAAGGPLTALRRRTRGAILEGLGAQIDIPPSLRRRMMRNPGGDALDAVIAAVGGRHAWVAADHQSIARHARYRHEGRLFV